LTTPAEDVDYLVVDLETTGLNPRRDHVLALGWVPISGAQVVLAGAREVLVRPPVGAPVGDSATVHGLTDDDLVREPTLADTLPELLTALHGRVLVAHHSPIELGFLNRATVAAYGARLPAVVVDTLVLQRRLSQQDHVPEGALRLDAARRDFGLPRYRAHRAVTDALATAELLLAQVAELGERLGRPPTLGDLAAR
jgi:DNA polymerase-3 subunit epsilon